MLLLRAGVAGLAALAMTLSTAVTPASAASSVLEPVVVAEGPGAEPEEVFGLVASNAGLLVNGSELAFGPELAQRRSIDQSGYARELAGALLVDKVYSPTSSSPDVRWSRLDGTGSGQQASQGTYLTSTPKGWAELHVRQDGATVVLEVDVTGGAPVRRDLGVLTQATGMQWNSFELDVEADASLEALVVEVPRQPRRFAVHVFGTPGFVALPDLPLEGEYSFVQDVAVAGTSVSVRRDVGYTGQSNVSLINRLTSGRTGWHQWAAGAGFHSDIVTAADATVWRDEQGFKAGPASGGPVQAPASLSGARDVAADDSGHAYVGIAAGGVLRREAVLSGTAQKVFQTELTALDVRGVDLSLGEVAWADNTAVDRPVWRRDLSTGTGRAVIGAKSKVVQRATSYSIARWAGNTAWYTYRDESGAGQDGLVVRNARGEDVLLAGADSALLGGQLQGSGRFLLAGGELLDLSTGALVMELPRAASLSGDRVAWLTETGAVRTRHLISGVEQQVAPPLPGASTSDPSQVWVSGDVAVAGDRVVWQRYVQDFYDLESESVEDVAWADLTTNRTTDITALLPAGAQVENVLANGRRFAVGYYDGAGPGRLQVFEFGVPGATAPVEYGDAYAGQDLFADALAYVDASNRVVVAALPPLSVPFDDAAGSGFAADISWLVQRGITSGYVREDGMPEFRPATAVSRQAMAAFLYRFAGASATPPTTPTFADVGSTHPFRTQVEWLAARGVTTGTVQPDGTRAFKPADPVSRQAMAAFLYRFAGQPAFTPPSTPTFTDMGSGVQFYKEVEWLASTGITLGTPQPDGTKLYKPGDAVSRQAMSAFLHRYADKGLSTTG